MPTLPEESGCPYPLGAQNPAPELRPPGKTARRPGPAPRTVARMADDCFAHPRLAALYDALHHGRTDLDAYLGMAEESGARRVLDIGCGTGVFALLLAGRGIEVVGVDPARASWMSPGRNRAVSASAGSTATPPACRRSGPTWRR